MESKSKSIFKQIKIFFAIGIMTGILYLMGLKSWNNRLREIAYIKRDFGITKGIVTKKKTYKGHSVSVEYYVKGILYEGKDGFDKKYENNFDQGDSIVIKYSKLKPELIINQFNSNF
ncbi:hypothetical protein Q1W71_04160 [Flavobacterium pectinovorum]|uniref:hypothetical protein n=1 Tax=Flavobacterium pectinovorum TaxID=29533 RepID=UPI00265E9888|nr:hypothetical protein [Flavobacterium pectinovorum]WKL48981.1 hypothetical protein Q1W71_04160 [Flavobacterium pectinovorum]